ncbi:AEC family transporter [Palleronia sediminis]|uniref:AEC family transporter n=1 Tax=Palleronia sediminis TaxID=2547833 RepID=A0A4R6ABT6_9RHOB|nr:AEC family transporter [Palleronia sediminis]TDL81280.1 AEC family transporter [Palleronia sediminis]
MSALLDVILPVFLVIGAGWLAVWRGLLDDNAVGGLMKFSQSVAIPCLLFRAIATLDLGQGFSWPLLISFYAGAVAGFVIGLAGARALGRPWEDAVVIGFAGLFSNTVLLGLPISERAFGAESLGFNFAIIAVHSPFGYALGVTAMELVRARGTPLSRVPAKIAGAMLHNALVIGIALGFAFNLSGLAIPSIAGDALDMVIRAALPAALFALGGVLYRYRPEGDLRIVALICTASLVIHPAIAYGLGIALGLEVGALRGAVVTAAMAPGMNAYIFANIYERAQRSAASGVLIATGVSIFSVWVWLLILP